MPHRSVPRILSMCLIWSIIGHSPGHLSGEERIPLLANWHLRSSYLVKADGAEISSPDYGDEGWHAIRIPTTVLAALVANGVYPDPYVGMNNMRIPDASPEFSRTYGLSKFTHLPGGRNPWKDPYWFRTRFVIPASAKGQTAWLHLDGINYRADVWLNGKRLADSRQIVGMFGNWTLDITGLIRFEEGNALAIKIHPLDYPGLPGIPQLEVFGPFGLNGGATGDIGKNVTMQSSVGWDWIPAVRDRNMGIWKDVSISFTGDVDIRHPFVVTDLPLPRTDAVEFAIRAELHNSSTSETSGTLRVVIRPLTFSSDEIVFDTSVTLAGGEQRDIRLDFRSNPELRMPQPRLWWPHQMGNQDLYVLELRMQTGDRIADTEIRRFGVREVGSRVSIEKDWQRREFTINGRKIFIRGGAWVPDMLLQRNPRRLAHELRLSREANLNMVRIWGGGVTPPDAFFQICDELGLLVWHDFWITGDCQGTWGKGSRDYPYDAGVFLKNAQDVVKTIRHHPSLLVWTAGNEGYPREEIYVPLRNQILAELDGTRPFIPSSGYQPPPEAWGLSWPDGLPAGTYSGGPYQWVDPRDYFRRARKGEDWLFKNEVGLPSLPELDSLRRFIPDLAPDPQVRFPLNHVWGYHDACEGNGRYSSYDQAIRERLGEPRSLADYVTKAQVLNAENYRGIFEAINLHRERTSGVILWKTNPAWPSVIWQLYDWYLSPHAGYYYSRKACEPLHIQMNLDDLAVCVVNHHAQSYSRLTARAEVYDLDMKRLWRREAKLDIGPDSCQVMFEMKLPPSKKRDLFFVKLSLRDPSGEHISDNFYWLAEDDDYTRLSQLPTVDLDVQSRIRRKDTEIEGSLVLENPSEHLAFFVRPAVLAGERGEEVLPSYWSDRYFALLPGESISLTVEIPSDALAGRQPWLKIAGWNIAEARIPLDQQQDR